MKLTNRVLSTYAADISGVCSALYELGGIIVMHDASGCNSTYTTHDEPRWYKMDSLVYISALTELEAVMGDDDKLIRDIVDAANNLHPNFIAIGGTPIPMMMGTDFKGLSRVIEKRTGIQTFGFATNGMHSYIDGIAVALEAIADRFCPTACDSFGKQNGIPINLLGITPLDFSLAGNVEAIKQLFEDNGFPVVSCWAMGSDLQILQKAGTANVNVVVSAAGLPAARKLQEKYKTPYVVGLPIGKKPTQRLFDLILQSYETGKSLLLRPEKVNTGEKPIVIIGEQVFATALRCCLEEDFGIKCIQTICPLNPEALLMTSNDIATEDEDEITVLVAKSRTVIADPIYRHILPTDGSVEFIDIPHEAYSGRIYHEQMKTFIGNSIFQILLTL